MPFEAAVAPVTPFQQNCTLIWCDRTRRGAFVDPGGEVERLVALAEEKAVTVERVLLTHGHLDHAGGARELADRLRIPIEGPHRDDQFWLDGIEQSAAKYGFAGGRSLAPDRWLEHGDTVSFGDVTLDVLHTPGHTPGHVVFFSSEMRFAFVGDVIFRGSVGRTDFPRGDFDQLAVSIREKLFPLGDDVTFMPGHGPMSTFGHERRTNPFVSDAKFG
jgi:hydroxyacylglutathione hydrolase